MIFKLSVKKICCAYKNCVRVRVSFAGERAKIYVVEHNAFRGTCNAARLMLCKNPAFRIINLELKKDKFYLFRNLNRRSLNHCYLLSRQIFIPVFVKSVLSFHRVFLLQIWTFLFIWIFINRVLSRQLKSFSHFFIKKFKKWFFVRKCDLWDWRAFK